MSSVFRATTIDDEPRIIEFLARIFSVGSNAPLLNPALLRWKFWEPRAGFPDPRSFVMEKAGVIVGHVGLWPLTLRTDTGLERGVHMIDWAADPKAPGAGISMLQKLTATHDFIYAIGGSETTQTLLPKFGFRTVAEALTLARPIRPFRQILHHQTRDVRLPLRLLRNLWWSKNPGRGDMRGWQAAEAAPSDWELISQWSRERDAAFFHYLERCPAARFLPFGILHQGRKVGLFALSIVGEQARLAGVLLEQPDREHWRIAYSLAQDVALRYTKTSELVARIAADGVADIAAIEAGLQIRERFPVFLFRKKDTSSDVPLRFQMWDNDRVFLGYERDEFLT